ncbi:MAG: flagellar hook capping FlgD N-terminal domain-containing protein [Massilia sp.]
MLTNFNTTANTGTGAAGDTVSASAAASDNKDMFTKLLVAQIRNQDPLSPTDPSQFVNQLSQLSQTEALQNLTKSQTASASILQSMQVLAMGAQVGSSVSVATGSVRLGDAAFSGTVNLNAASNATTLTLTGIDGQPHQLTLPAHGSGPLAFTIDPLALGLAPGNYRISAQAADGSAPAVEVTGRLDSVRMSATGGVVLQVANIGEVDPSAITGFNGKASAASVAALP